MTIRYIGEVPEGDKMKLEMYCNRDDLRNTLLELPNRHRYTIRVISNDPGDKYVEVIRGQ